jgi:DNA repair protein RadC
MTTTRRAAARSTAPPRATRGQTTGAPPAAAPGHAAGTPAPPAPDGAERQYLLIRDLPSSERPRERLARYGPEQLTTGELLAIIWRTGTSGRERESAVTIANRALTRFGGLAGLARASSAELEALKGVGPVKAIELRAALELGRRLATMQPEDRPVIRSPRDVFHLVHSELALLPQEHLRVLLLNSKNQVLAVREVYRGTLNSSSVRIGELFREAIRENCASLVIVHNHPSGDPTPSPEDVRVTAEAVRAGRLLDVEVLDHVIVGAGPDRFVSLKERGLGFS